MVVDPSSETRARGPKSPWWFLCDVESMEVIRLDVGGHGLTVRALVDLREHERFERRSVDLERCREVSSALGTRHHECLGHYPSPNLIFARPTRPGSLFEVSVGNSIELTNEPAALNVAGSLAKTGDVTRGSRPVLRGPSARCRSGMGREMLVLIRYRRVLALLAVLGGVFSTDHCRDVGSQQVVDAGECVGNLQVLDLTASGI